MAIYGSLGDIEVTSTDYPSIQPTLDLNFAKTKALDPRIIFYRNSLGTYTDDKGIIRTVPENVPRFDHNPATGESLGLLIEESRTNFVFGSGGSALYAGYNFSAESIWTITAASTDVTAPDGSSTTTKASAGSSGNTYFWRYANTFSHSPNTTYTQSVWIRVASGTGSIGLSSYPFGQTYYANTITTQWQRISVTYTTDSGPSAVPYMGIVSPSANTTYYLWGWQIEQGSGPTSYIPTSGSAVTRAADVCYMDGTNFSSWYNPIESTFYTNYIMNSLDGAYNNPSFYAYDNASAQNYLAIFGYNPAYAWAQASNATAAGISLGGTTTTNVDYKVSFGVKVNDFAASINGSAVSTDASGNVPVVNQMFIGKRVEVSNAHLNGTLKRLTYYPKRLTNAQLQNLTA